MSNRPKKSKSDFDTTDILKRTTKSMAEGITGLASSDRKDLVLSIGHIFQKIMAGEFIVSLGNEWEEFRKKGRIKEDYEGSSQHKACLQEMLNFLDKDQPDDIRFNLLKKIFLVSATEEKSDRDSVLPQQYMRITRTLSSGEILIISTCYKLLKEGKGVNGTEDTTDWAQQIADDSGLKHSEIVLDYEKILMEKRLLTKRADGSPMVSFGPYNRLTNLAYSLCQFIDEDNNE